MYEGHVLKLMSHEINAPSLNSVQGRRKCSLQTLLSQLNQNAKKARIAIE